MKHMAKRWLIRAHLFVRWLEWKWKGLWVALAVFMPLAACPLWIQPRQTMKMGVLLVFVIALLVLALLHRCIHNWSPLRARWFVGWMIGLVTLVGVSAWCAPSVWEGWLGVHATWSEAVLPLAAFGVMAILIAQGAPSGLWRVGAWSFAASISLGSALLLVSPFVASPLLAAWVGAPSTVQVLTVVAWLWAAILWLFEPSLRDVWLPSLIWQRLWRAVGILLTVEVLLWALWADAWPLFLLGIMGGVLLSAFVFLRPSIVASRARFGGVALITLLFVVGWLLPIGRGFIPAEVNMSQAFSWRLAQSTWAEHGGVFGAGPDAFRSLYTRLRPAEAVNVAVGEQGFEHAGNALATLAATWGLAPIAWFAFGLVGILVVWARALWRRRSREEWAQLTFLGVPWLVLVFALAVLPFDAVLWWMFWAGTGLLVAYIAWLAHPAVSPRKLGERNHMLLIGSTAVSIILFLGTVIYVGGLFASEHFLARAVRLEAQGGEATAVAASLRTAARWRPTSAALARALAGASVRVLAQPGLPASEAKAYAELAVSQAARALHLSPQDVRNADMLAQVYTALVPAVPGAAQAAVAARRNALALDPQSLTRQVDLAKALIALADEQQSVAVSPKAGRAAAQPFLQEADTVLAGLTARWPLYAPAIYTRAALRDRQGRLPDALAELKALAAGRPKDAGVWFELGVLSLRASKTEQAIRAFQQAATLVPTFANAKWYLASLYADMGQTDAAITLLQDVKTLNPENALVASKLHLLESGAWNPTASVEPLE
jgi:tetratricopeptide (TPR) repeat protein